jgi:hypothetical protein
MIGCEQFVKFDELNFNPEWENNMFNKIFNVNDYTRKRNAVKFDVDKVDTNGKLKFD